MSARRQLWTGSLGTRILAAVTGGAAVAMVSLLSLYLLTTRSQARLMGATDELVEEQDIADGITEGVMRQLLAVSTISELGGAGARSDFALASDSVLSYLRLYLRRDLTPEERLQLERVREEHQKLEVTALRAIDYFSRGQTASAEVLGTNMTAQASSLMEETASFLALRETSLRDLREHQTATLQLIHRAGGTLTVLLLLGTLAIGSYLHRRVSHPLDELTAAARRLGEGDLGVRVGGKFDDEFADLAGAFNAMATSLEAASRSLESRNEELVAALTRVRETQAELLAAEKLGAMGRMTAGLAHQLNNPLASVLGFAELLDGRLAEDHDPTATELREELVQPILLEARRTHNLIRSFLQFARHSAPGVSPVVVREALDVVVGLRSFAFQEAGLSIRIDDIPAAPVLAERQKLQEIFLNLVNNAHEAMGGTEGGVLGIRGHTEGGMLVLVFEDDGPGLESPDLVFEPFYTTKAVGQGTGLGLALVHRFVEEFGGSVQAANRSGGGAGFTLRLPMVQAQAGTSAAHTTPDQAPPPATEPVAHPARVLVVEDEPHLRNLQRRLLDRLGVEVLLAADVPEARRILEAEDLDLVLSDVKMPGETGMDLYRWLLGRRPELTDRFLFVTGDTEAPEIRELAKERPAMFIRKPFEMQEYSARVTAVLREAGSRE